MRTNVELMDAVLADMGAIHRRATNETLNEQDFRQLMSRARWNATALRQRLLDEEEPPIELTDKTQAVILAGKVGRHPHLVGILRRLPGLMTGRELADRGLADRGLARLRTVSDGARTLGVVEGGQA